jgi:two-component system response regulator NreC
LTIRVLIADDHAVVRGGLRRILETADDIEVVGEAADGRQAVFETIETGPDVVLMDVAMPERTGLEAIPTVRRAAPDARVLVVSTYDDVSTVRRAFEAGASGYLLKDAVHAELVQAVREVAGGRTYVHPAVGARVVAAEVEARRRAEDDPLSDREHEVLRLLALGHTNQEIAGMLSISVRTAETHRAHIMQKLRLETRAELVRYAISQGLLDDAR